MKITFWQQQKTTCYDYTCLHGSFVFEKSKVYNIWVSKIWVLNIFYFNNNIHDKNAFGCIVKYDILYLIKKNIGL
jgi:hypothetical protein